MKIREYTCTSYGPTERWIEDRGAGRGRGIGIAVGVGVAAGVGNGTYIILYYTILY